MVSPAKVLPAGAAVLATLGITTLTAASPVYASVGSTPKLNLQQAEHIAVTTFSIPATYALQNESYNSSNSSIMPASYQLSYQDSALSGANHWMNITIDANSGTILNFNQSTTDNQFVFPVPVTAGKAQQIADQWAEKLYPSQFGNVQALPLTPGSGALTSPTEYTYNYERMVDGVPAPFNGFTITIDQDGNLVSVNDSWSDLTFPKASVAIQRTGANSVYQKALALHLEYQSVYHMNSQPTTELIYQASPQNYPNYWNTQYSGQDLVEFPVINAASGQIVDATGQPVTPQAYVPPKPLVSGGPKLPENAPAVNWSQQQAEQYAENVFGITGADTLQSVNQYQSPGADTTWNFSWLTADQMSLQVSVDATYGVITNYNTYPSQGKPVSPATGTDKSKLTQSQIDKAAQDFVKKVFPNNTGGLAVIPSPYPSKDPSTNLNTSYQIVVLSNGIPDQTRSGNLNVNPQTGQVQNLWMNIGQSKGTPPDPTKALPVSKAVATWMSGRPLTLEYLETQPGMNGKFMPAATGKGQPTPTPEVVLAYAPTADQNSSGQFNAITGAFETSGSQTTPYSGPINDLSGNPASAQIELLVNRELVAVDSKGDVHPEQTMTHSAYIKLLVDALGLQSRYNQTAMASSAAKATLAAVPTNSPDYQEIGAAYSMGWIPSDEPFNPNTLTTRDYAAQVLARALGFTPLLAHPEAFQFHATDATSIQTSHQAADALAVTLGLMPLQSGAFNPSANVTLADVAVAVVQAAVIEGQQGNPYPPVPQPLG